MSTKAVRVEQTVEVTLDESKFTPQFMEEFRASMYPFKTIDDHREHLAQLYARGIASDKSFIEGYGPAEEMGISFGDVYQTQETVETV